LSINCLFEIKYIIQQILNESTGSFNGDLNQFV